MIVQPDIHDVVAMFFRRKKLFLASLLLVAGSGAAYLQLTTPLYRSEASVVVRFDDKSIPETNLARETSATVTAQNDRHETVLAHTDILNSMDLARAVIEQLGLPAIYPDLLSAPPRRGTAMDEAVRRFGRSLFVDAEQQGDVINLGFSHANPLVARTVLHDLIGLYMEREASIFSPPDVAFQQAQVDAAADRLQQAQAALRDYKHEAGIAAFDEEMSALIRQRADTARAWHAEDVALVEATQRRNELRVLLKGLPASLANSAGGEKYHSLDSAQAALDALLLRQHQLEATYRSDHPVMAQLRASIATATTELAERRREIGGREQTMPNLVFQNIQTDLMRATAEVEAHARSAEILQLQVASLDQKREALEQQRIGLLERTRAVELADATFRGLSLHLEDARVAEARLRERISHGAVITEPTLPYRPSQPRYIAMSGSFGLAALLLGCGAVLFAELLDDCFTGPTQITRRLDIPVLAIFDEVRR